MKIAILTGGLTGERSVSIASANNIQNLLSFADCHTFTLPEQIHDFIKSHKGFDIVVPVIHGKGGEDGSIQGLLESLGIPYLFSGIAAHAIAIDKKRTKQIARMLGHRTPNEITQPNLTFPLFAKPRFGGSSVNSGLCQNEKELKDLLDNTTEELIHEEPVKGREFTVGVVEYNNETIALPVIEIVTPKDTFFDFEHKYDPNNLAEEICPAQIPEALASKLKSCALSIHKELGVKHISRSDFIVSADGEPYFLEINTIPGMTNTSLVPKMLASAEIDATTLLKQWLS